MDPGFRLRQIRERLGLTYRDVERASLSLARLHARPHFTVHISRLADIENAGVVPSLAKLYALAVIYHVNPLEISSWYEIPLDRFLRDAVSFSAPRTHLMSSSGFLQGAEKNDSQFLPERTEFLARSAAANCDGIDSLLKKEDSHHRYGCIGLRDRRMEPILRPGSLVLVDVSVRRLQDSKWSNEYDRPMYFVELHDGYRCGWFHQEGARLAMHPHPLSRCMPEYWKTPDDAEIVGRVVGVVTRLPVPATPLSPESLESREHSSKRAL
jgi:transcriptional regulator with XRE-family HTH domain